MNHDDKLTTPQKNKNPNHTDTVADRPFYCNVFSTSISSHQTNGKSPVHQHKLFGTSQISPSKSKPLFKCNICMKPFYCRKKLATHQLGHATDSQYICRDCNRSFTSKTQLTSHKMIHSWQAFSYAGTQDGSKLKGSEPANTLQTKTLEDRDCHQKRSISDMIPSYQDLDSCPAKSNRTSQTQTNIIAKNVGINHDTSLPEVLESKPKSSQNHKEVLFGFTDKHQRGNLENCPASFSETVELDGVNANETEEKMHHSFQVKIEDEEINTTTTTTTATTMNVPNSIADYYNLNHDVKEEEQDDLSLLDFSGYSFTLKTEDDVDT